MMVQRAAAPYHHQFSVSLYTSVVRHVLTCLHCQAFFETHVEILPLEVKAKYLEQMITFVDQETTEVQRRIRCAWSAFTKHRQELTSQSYLLRHRLHLFDAVVAPTITYGAGSWATTKEHEQCSALHSAECLDLASRQKENTKAKNWKKTFVKTKYGRILKKKIAHMKNTTKTAVFHSSGATC